MTSVLISYEGCFQKMRFVPTWKLGNKVVKAYYAIQAVVRCLLLLLFDKRIKILHIHGAANASFYRKKIFIKIGKMFHKRIIFHQHAADFEDFYNRSSDKENIVKIFNMADRVIVLSESWKKYFTNIGVVENKIYVLNNIVPYPDQKQIGIDVIDNKIHILYLGEISHRKGIYDLLSILKENRAYFENKIYLRVGGNSVDGDIDSFILQNNLSSFVKYEGWVSGTKKIQCLNWADVYILPSYNEGLPIAILEAMSYSHPIISTNVGGIPEILFSHENGILVEPGDLDKIKEAIIFFIEHPEKIAEYGQNAYVKVQPFFTNNVCKKLEDIYRDLLYEQ